jgi:hypothetical protein
MSNTRMESWVPTNPSPPMIMTFIAPPYGSVQRHTPFSLLRILLSPDERQDLIDLKVY